MGNTISAAARARWLAQLTHALDQAWAAVEKMPVEVCGSDKRRELLRRIEAARRAAKTLRLASERRIERTTAPD